MRKDTRSVCHLKNTYPYRPQQVDGYEDNMKGTMRPQQSGGIQDLGSETSDLSHLTTSKDVVCGVLADLHSMALRAPRDVGTQRTGCP
eukprot:scaffold50301_cov63-Cyclotella_meneghiniana.AAC.1